MRFWNLMYRCSYSLNTHAWQSSGTIGQCIHLGMKSHLLPYFMYASLHRSVGLSGLQLPAEVIVQTYHVLTQIVFFGLIHITYI